MKIRHALGKSLLAGALALCLAPAVHAQAPTVVAAFGEYDSGVTVQNVDITYSAAMDPATTLTAANYTIAGFTITNVQYFTNNTGVISSNLVILQGTPQLTGPFSVGINNVKSAAGTAIAANTVAAATLDPMSSIDIATSEIATNGTTFYEGPGTYLVNASGNDIWNAADGFRFIYETRTNNFDLVVKVPFIDNADAWTKAGLMIREAIDPGDGGARMYYNVTTALAAQKGVDGGFGVNTTSEGCRETSDVAAVGPPTGYNSYVPDYPNVWLRLTRELVETTTSTNDTIVGYYSTNDVNWEELGVWNPVTDGALAPFPNVSFVGLCTTAHTSPDIATTMYDSYGDYAVNITISKQPQPVTVASGDSATFSVGASGDSTIAINGTPTTSLTYQWYTNGAPVPGANAAILSVPNDLTLDELTVAQSGMSVYCIVSSVGHNTGTQSTSAMLTVTANAEAPTVSGAFAEFDSGTSNAYVDVTFNEAMSVSGLLNPANYSIAGSTITGVSLYTNNLGIASSNEVVLQLSAPITGAFSLGINGIDSFSGTPIATDTVAAGSVDPLSSIDITALNAAAPEITTNGSTFYQGPGDYEVTASGNDIWNASDGFRFVYETRTNSFAVVVQVDSLIPADTWTKAGLMVRESIDPATGESRYFDAITTPATGQIGLDGAGPENSLSVDARTSTDASSEEPPGFIGDGKIAPNYPNQWILLVRQIVGSNDYFTAYSSTDTTNWTWLSGYDPLINGSDTAYPSVANVGMCTVAHVAPPSPFLATVEYTGFGDYTDTNITVTESPKSQTIASATTATFTVATSANKTAIFPNATNGLVGYQWYTNGVPVPDAYSYTWTTPSATIAMSNMSVYCSVFPIGVGPDSPLAVNSATATLDVYLDTTPSIPTAYGTLDSGGGGASGAFSGTNQNVDVTFSLPMNSSAIDVANYMISGNTITNAYFFVNDQGVVSSTEVVLQLSKVLTAPFTLNIATNVANISGIGVSAGTALSCTLDPMISMDIAAAEEQTNGYTYFISPGNYEVDASGYDMWNNQDGFRFVYQPVTNNFDIKVQVSEDLGADSWSKAGLMVREMIDPDDGGSRMMFWVTTPAAGTTILDGGTPENSLSMGARVAPDGGSAETPNVTWTGDGAAQYAPHYPNVWLRMSRQYTVSDATTNDLFTTYYSTNGSDWTVEGYFDPATNGQGSAVAFPSVVYVGMAATAHNDNTPVTPQWRSTAIFNNYGPTATLAAPPTITVSRSGGNLNISWSPAGGTLYSSPVLTATASSWTPVTTSNPTVIPIGAGSLFFEIRE